MMLKSAKFGSGARRCFNTLPDNIDINHPKIGIVKNFLKLRRIAAATCETSLKAAQTDPVSLEQIIAQPHLTEFEYGLLSTTTKVYHAPYVPNPKAWQHWHWTRQTWREMKDPINYCYIGGFA
jgi:hypothetical protein